jgi:hypothetical protein
VVRLLSGAGQSAVDALVKQAPNRSRLWQLNAARILCAARGKAAVKGLLQLLISGTDEFNKAVCDFMTPAIRGMDSKEQESLYAEVEAFALKLDVTQQRPAAVSALSVGQLGFGKPAAGCSNCCPDTIPARSHALAALLHYPVKQDLRKDEHATSPSPKPELPKPRVGSGITRRPRTSRLPPCSPDCWESPCRRAKVCAQDGDLARRQCVRCSTVAIGLSATGCRGAILRKSRGNCADQGTS